MSPHPGTLFTAQLFDNPGYSDITIRIGNILLRCHKLVICRFEYFDKLCGARSSFAESKQDTIELQDDDPIAAKAIIQYLYTGRYYDRNDTRKNDWKFHLHLTIAANKYLLRDLEGVTFARFHVLLDALPDPAEIFDAICHIENTCIDPEILEVADDLRLKHMHSFLRDPELAKHQTQAAIRAYYLKVEAFQKGFVKVEAYVCPNCARRKHFVDGKMGLFSSVCTSCWCPDGGHPPKIHPTKLKRREGSEYWAANYDDAKELAKAMDKLTWSRNMVLLEESTYRGH